MHLRTYLAIGNMSVISQGLLGDNMSDLKYCTVDDERVIPLYHSWDEALGRTHGGKEEGHVSRPCQFLALDNEPGRELLFTR